MRQAEAVAAANGARDPAAGLPITLVTGLPRSGTSLLMQLLAAGGCPVLTDDARPADAGNPWGYLEYDPVTRLHRDTGWLPAARGRVLKVVAPLLPLLPPRAADGSPLHYRVVFMNRDLREVAQSQARLLLTLGRAHLAQPLPLVLRGLERQLAAARTWVRLHAVPALELGFHATLADPGETARRLAAFIPGYDPLGAGTLIH